MCPSEANWISYKIKSILDEGKVDDTKKKKLSKWKFNGFYWYPHNISIGKNNKISQWLGHQNNRQFNDDDGVCWTLLCEKFLPFHHRHKN